MTNKGFTLIEVLIYSLIFVIITGGMTLFAISILTASERADSQVELSDNSRFMIQKIQQNLRGTSTVNSPTVGNTATSLSINTASASANPVVFDLSGGAVRMKVASASPLPLTNTFVEVMSISFQNYSFSTGTKNTIRIKGKMKTSEAIRPASSSFDIFISVQ